ncbi:GNAT family N-acetyltransferase [Aestuariivirga sp.]|uniref:GNAT family N-acetyltransferase n=1 Tax=Aestuariivirga sp. TaxID=2650926 RepID=UPI0039E54A30
MPILDLPNGYYELPPGKLANVVTCLEMKAKPHRALQPFPAELRLKRFAAGDLEGHRALFRAVGSDLMWFSRLIMKDQDLAAILANPAIESFALMQGSDTLGMLELNFSDLPNCELAFYGLVPEAIGQGFGRVLMDEAIRRAWAKPIERFWVHTCTFDSPLALPFYIRSGFTPYLRMVEVHDDPRLLGKLAMDASPQVPVLG